MKIGIDLGGTKIEGILLDDAGEVLFKKRVPTPQQDYSKTLLAIKETVGFLEHQVGPASVGIGTPGARSESSGLMKNCNSTCLNGQPFLEDVSEILARPVRIANDADCFTLSESVDGAAKDDAVVFGVIIGTGVGGGVAVNQRLLSGANRITGEWGHNPMPRFMCDGAVAVSLPANGYLERGRPCYCGKQNCIETFLSGPSFQRNYQRCCAEQSGDEYFPEENCSAEEGRSAEEIVALAEKGDLLARSTLAAYFNYLAMGLAGVINVLDPNVIVLGGGMSNIAGLVEGVTQILPRYVFSDQVLTRLTCAKYGDSSGVRGAAWLW